MPTFKVHLEYTDAVTDTHKKVAHPTKANSPEEAARMARSVYKNEAYDGQIIVTKTKLVRDN